MSEERRDCAAEEIAPTGHGEGADERRVYPGRTDIPRQKRRRAPSALLK